MRPRLHREFRGYRGLLAPPEGTSGPPPPPEWGGLTPVADWDAANSVLTGDNVIGVLDSSGGGVNLVGAGTSLPQYILSDPDYGGNPSINIAADSQGRRLTFSALTLTNSGPICVVMVAKSNDLGTNSNRYIFSMSSDDVAIYHQELNDRYISFISDGGGTMCLSNDNPPTPFVVMAKSGGSSTNQSLYVNSDIADQTAASGAGAITYGAGTVGVYAPAPTTNNFAGNCTVARVLVFAANPTAGQVTSIINALRTKYSV